LSEVSATYETVTAGHDVAIDAAILPFGLFFDHFETLSGGSWQPSQAKMNGSNRVVSPRFDETIPHLGLSMSRKLF
jgi:hypothetical protein